MNRFLSEIYNRNKVLTLVGGVLFVVTFLLFGAILFDRTEVEGFNRWNKPFRFILSCAIFSWTMAWTSTSILAHGIRRFITTSIGLLTLVGCSVVLMQAWRGVASHYNTQSPFDATANGILQFTSSMTWLCMWFATLILFKQRKSLHGQHYTWGIRMAYLIFSLGTTIGMFMWIRMSHDVGNTNELRGMPLLNWNMNRGDLRIPLFLSIHALQIIPMVSHFLLEKKRQVMSLSVLYLVVILVFLALALMSVPIFNFR